MGGTDMDMTVNETRAILVLAAVALGVFVLMASALEAARAEQRAEQATIRADVAAWEVSRLLQEARDITQAAVERGTP